jgi:hypothetical protein
MTFNWDMLCAILKETHLKDNILTSVRYERNLFE